MKEVNLKINELEFRKIKSLSFASFYEFNWEIETKIPKQEPLPVGALVMGRYYIKDFKGRLDDELVYLVENVEEGKEYELREYYPIGSEREEAEIKLPQKEGVDFYAKFYKVITENSWLPFPGIKEFFKDNNTIYAVILPEEIGEIKDKKLKPKELRQFLAELLFIYDFLLKNLGTSAFVIKSQFIGYKDKILKIKKLTFWPRNEVQDILKQVSELALQLSSIPLDEALQKAITAATVKFKKLRPSSISQFCALSDITLPSSEEYIAKKYIEKGNFKEADKLLKGKLGYLLYLNLKEKGEIFKAELELKKIAELPEVREYNQYLVEELKSLQRIKSTKIQELHSKIPFLIKYEELNQLIKEARKILNPEELKDFRKKAEASLKKRKKEKMKITIYTLGLGGFLTLFFIITGLTEYAFYTFTLSVISLFVIQSWKENKLKKKLAMKLMKEAEILAALKKYDEALRRIQESKKISDVNQYVQEDKIKRMWAKSLMKEAVELSEQGRYMEAARKLEQSRYLKILNQSEIEKKIGKEWAKTVDLMKKYGKDKIFREALLKAKEFYINTKGYPEAVFYNNTVMIYIPPGEFLMGLPEGEGEDDEQPQRRVWLSGYWISKYEVTFSQYDNFCEDTGKEKPEDEGYGRGNLPVINISWFDAIEYCKWLSEKTGLKFRLPTEAEWEKAARGTDGRRYPWGDFPPNCSLAQYLECKGAIKPVDSFPAGASPYGVLDMVGNVWEWVADWYSKDYYSKEKNPKDPQGPAEGNYRVLRGGNWKKEASILRVTFRNCWWPDGRHEGIGFRIAIGRKLDSMS